MRNGQQRRTVVHVVNSLEGGGTERTLVSLLSAFDHHDTAGNSIRPAESRSHLRHAVCTLRRAGALSDRLPDCVPCHPMNIVGRSRAGGFRLARAIAPRRPAIIHARNFGCWAESLAAGLMLRRCSVLLGFHGLERDGVFNTKQRRLARWAFRLGARFTSVSYAGRDKLTREAGIPPRRIDVLTNGVDLDRFARDDGSRRDIVRQCFGYSPQDIVLGSVASRHGCCKSSSIRPRRDTPTVAPPGFAHDTSRLTPPGGVMSCTTSRCEVVSRQLSVVSYRRAGTSPSEPLITDN